MGLFQTLVALQKVVSTPSAGPTTHGWEDLAACGGSSGRGDSAGGLGTSFGFVTRLHVLYILVEWAAAGESYVVRATQALSLHEMELF